MTSSTVRKLSSEELALVCGGTTLPTVTVTGSYDPPPDTWEDYGPPDFYDPWDQPYYDGGGGGGGGGGGDTTTDQVKELGKALIEIAEMYKAGTGTSGTIFAAMDYSKLSADTVGLTIQWAIRDIEFYRDIGMHVPSAQGSLIAWQNVQVDWSKYDQGGTPEDVLRNFLNSLE